MSSPTRHRSEPPIGPGGGRPVGGSASEWVVDLKTAVRFFRRHALIGLAFAVIAALGTWLTVRSAAPVYRSTATVALFSSPALSTGVPTELSVQTYQELLESPGVVAETVVRLREAGTLGPGEGLSVGAQLRSSIFVARREETRALAPLLEAEARSSRPEDAAAIANTWAQVLVEQANRLAVEMASESNEAIDELHRSLGGSLFEAERGRDALASDLERRRTELLLAWDREVLRTREKTLETLRDTSAASRRRMDEAVDRWFAAIRSGPGGDSVTAADLRDRATNLGRAMNGLAEASAVLVGASPPAEPRPTFTEEEALAAALSPSLTPGGEALLGGSSHPGYAQLLAEVHRATGELIERASAHGASVAELIRALQEIQESQVAEYAKVLSQRRTIEMGVLRRRDEAVAALEREGEEALGQRDREVLRLESLLEGAGPALERAALERAASGVQSVRLAVPAVASPSPLGTGLKRFVLIAALVGWLVGTALSALWTISRE